MKKLNQNNKNLIKCRFLFLFLTTIFFQNIFSQTVKYTFINKQSRIVNSTDTITIYWKIDSTESIHLNNRNYYKFIFDEDSSYSRGFISIDLSSKKYFFIRKSNKMEKNSTYEIDYFSLLKNRTYKIDYFFPMLIKSKLKVHKFNGIYVVTIFNLNEFSISDKLIMTNMIFDDKLFPSIICLSSGHKLYSQANY